MRKMWSFTQYQILRRISTIRYKDLNKGDIVISIGREVRKEWGDELCGIVLTKDNRIIDGCMDTSWEEIEIYEDLK